MDDGVVDFFNKLLGCQMPRVPLFMKLKDGGFGFGSAEMRGPAALLAAWEGGIQDIAEYTEHESWTTLQRAWPGLMKAIDGAEQHQQALSGSRPKASRWQALVEGRQGTSQKEYTAEARNTQLERLCSLQDPGAAAARNSASGPSAGAWLETSDGQDPVSDQTFGHGCRRRAHVPVLATATKCCNVPKGQVGTSRFQCGKAVCVHGTHCQQCPRGGGPTMRHDAIRNDLAKWIRDHLGVAALTEQVIPEWWQRDEGDARLDVVYTGRSGRLCLDVSLVDSVHAALHGAGAAATRARRERAKHVRYPSKELVPFVVDLNGRWGHEAETWLRKALLALPAEDRVEARRNLRGTIARTLQHHLTSLMATATPNCGRSL